MPTHRALIGLALALLVPAVASAAHHESTQDIAPAATAGQVVVIYEWPCRDVEGGVAVLKKLIAYEAGVTPIPYSSVPVVHNAYNVGAIDVHASLESFEKAGAWQAGDAGWQEIVQEMAAVCESPVENLSVTVLPAF